MHGTPSPAQDPDHLGHRRGRSDGGPSRAADRTAESPRELLQELQDDIGTLRSYRVAGTSRDADGTTTLRADVTAAGSLPLTATAGRDAFALRVVRQRT